MKLVIVDNGVEFLEVGVVFIGVVDFYYVYLYCFFECGINEVYNWMICCDVFKGLFMDILGFYDI